MLQSGQLVERNWMFALLFAVTFITALFAQLTPSPSFVILFASELAIFALTSSIASWHHRRIKLVDTAVDKLPKAASVLVIVSARNEEAVIGKAVETILQLDYPDYQLLVVDDRSTDATPQILRRLQTQYAQKLKIHTRAAGAKGGKAVALNEVTNLSQSDVIAIFDADTIIESDFLQRTVFYFDDDNVAAVQARKSLLNAKENILTRCQHYEYLTDAYIQSQRDKIVGAVELRGNGMLIRTSALHKLGGFCENNLTEDLDLSTRFHIDGLDVRYAADVQVFEECPAKISSLLHQRIRWTEGSLIRIFDHAGKIFLSVRNSFRSKIDCFLFVLQFVAPLWLAIESICAVTKAALNQTTVSPVFFASSTILVLSLYFFYAAVRGIIRFKEDNVVIALLNAAMLSIYLSTLFPLIVIYLAASMLSRTERSLKWVKIPHYGVLTK